MADLITLTELRSVLGTDASDTRDNAKYTALIPYVATVIANYTGRDFTVNPVTETRMYRYDGSGSVDIDDATDITAVAMAWPTDPSIADVTIDTRDWQAQPDLGGHILVHEYINIPGYSGRAFGGSPEMGFKRNLDVYARERDYLTMPPYVKVSATFGWPKVPNDVKMAAIWTLQEWVARPSGDALASESIEGYSRAWGDRSGMQAALALPSRAQDVLASYAKVFV